MSDTIGDRVAPPTGDRALDAYSQVVTEVAAELTLRVAALQMSRRRRDGRVEGSAGSAVVFTESETAVWSAEGGIAGPEL